VVFMIELGKNLRFRVGSSTQVFDISRPCLRVKTEFFVFLRTTNQGSICHTLSTIQKLICYWTPNHKTSCFVFFSHPFKKWNLCSILGVDGLDNFYFIFFGITLLYGYVNTLVASALIVLFVQMLKYSEKKIQNAIVEILKCWMPK
jgi:hypothetical protein